MRVLHLNFGYEPVFAKLTRNQNLEVKLASCIYELEVIICYPCETFHCRSHRNSCGSQNLPPQLLQDLRLRSVAILRAHAFLIVFRRTARVVGMKNLTGRMGFSRHIWTR